MDFFSCLLVATHCNICKESIGFFSAAFKDVDEKGNETIYCSKCHQNEKERKRKEKKKAAEELKSEEQKLKLFKEQRDKEQEQRNKEEARILLQKYLSNNESTEKPGIIKGIIASITRDPDVAELIQGHTLDNLRRRVNNNLSNASTIEAKNAAEMTLDALDDLEKIHKLLQRNGKVITYHQLFSITHNIMQTKLLEERERAVDEIIRPLKKRQEKRGAIDRKLVIRTFFRFCNDRDSIDYHYQFISRMLEKLDLSYEENELKGEIRRFIDDEELDAFEKNLVSEKKNTLHRDYTDLNGYDFEEYMALLFKNLGYTAKTTPKTGDQGADLIIMKDNKKTVVQAKKYSGLVSNSAIQEIVAAKKYYGAEKAIVVTNSDFTKSAKELALCNEVELWNGEKLKEKASETNNQKHRLSTTMYNIGGKFKSHCIWCEEELELNLNDKELIETGRKEIICPCCGMAAIAHKE